MKQCSFTYIKPSRPGRSVLTALPRSAAPYVKVYLVDGKRCLSKAKTTTARRTLDPFYQQTLVFTEKYAGCVLQVRKAVVALFIDCTLFLYLPP